MLKSVFLYHNIHMKKNIKYFIYIPLIIIMVFSFLNMINARLIDNVYNNHLIKQIIWYILGFGIIFIFSKINVKKLFNLSFVFYLLSIILLILVLFLGKEINGAKAWFHFGFFSFQPSELCRLTLTLFLVNLTNKFNKQIKKNEIKYIFLMILATLIPSILVFLEPDTGAIIFYLIIFLVCLFNAQINKKWFILIVISFIFLISAFFYLYFFQQDLLIKLIGTSFFYRIDRLIDFKNNYQITNALILIGSASFFGSGLNKASLYVPEAPTDFILSFSIGNFGLFGGIIILLSYLTLNLLLINLIKKANNKLFAKVFISLFLFQQLYNILMNIAFLPIMGIPLPFLSYGGSGLLIYFIFLAIFLRIT